MGAVEVPTIWRSQICKRSRQSVSILQSRGFQVHGVDAGGQVVIRRQLKRRYVLAFFQKLPPCLVGIEACASAHHWSRELQALGHTVKLMPPAYVKPYVKRHKNDAADAEAICEAVTRANMRFVATKTPEQQSCLTLHRTRHLLMRQQTSVINAIRAHLAEFGIVAPVGRQGVGQLLGVVAEFKRQAAARDCTYMCFCSRRPTADTEGSDLEFDRMIMAWYRSSEVSKRLDQVPGVGPVLATALVASVADPKAFRSGRDFSAWIGLVPKQNSKRRQGTARQYQQARRSLSAQPVYDGHACCDPLCQNPWSQASALANSVVARHPTKVAAIALANKIARMAWAMMAKGERYKNPSHLRRKRSRRDTA